MTSAVQEVGPRFDFIRWISIPQGNDFDRFTDAMRMVEAGAMSSRPSRNLETFPNPNPGRDYEIRFDCPEFTCLCPKTGQPDFARIEISYVPDRTCVELKSLKLYLWSYRDEGAFHEAVTNRIADDLLAAIAPRRLTVTGRFNVRGGIATDVIVRFPDR